jgi:hypothetical protein
MGIGASIMLLALGAILTFALDVQVGWLDLDVVGWILMAAGAIGLIWTTYIWNSRRPSTVVREPVVQEPAERIERTDITRPMP